jgi:hypothetical protein
MRRLLTIIAACVLGLCAAFLVRFVANAIRPCVGEQLACSMTSIIGFIYIPVFSGATLIASAIAMFWKGDVRALTIATLSILVPLLVLFTYVKYSEISVREWHEIREHDIQELLQVVIPIVLTQVVPWLVLRTYIARGRGAAVRKADCNG